MRVTADTQVCILGGGIAGTITACLLHDAGCRDIAIVDRSGAVMQGASRWNEGKVHLGFTYTGVADLATARLMMAGAADFEPVIRQVTGADLPADWWTDPVVYLVDKESIFPADVLWDRAQATAALLAGTADANAGLRQHLPDAPLLAKLDVETAMRETGQARVGAAWRTAERAVSTRLVADRLAEAADARRIQLLEANVHGVDGECGSWRIHLGGEKRMHARVVVNCLWESRAQIDNAAGMARETVTIRYKTGIFASGASDWRTLAPSTRIIGKFGDVTPYGNGDVYLSWYPTCLMAHARGDRPPIVPPIPNDDTMRAAIFRGLGLDERWLARLNGNAVIRGGYVVASGGGDISEPGSGLHDRSEPDARELAPGYVSVDTGKYTLGPMLARKASEIVLRRLGLQ